jgi:hypothetical protein
MAWEPQLMVVTQHAAQELQQLATALSYRTILA